MKINNHVAQLFFPATSEWIKLELHINRLFTDTDLKDSDTIQRVFCILSSVHY